MWTKDHNYERFVYRREMVLYTLFPSHVYFTQIRLCSLKCCIVLNIDRLRSTRIFSLCRNPGSLRCSQTCHKIPGMVRRFGLSATLARIEATSTHVSVVQIAFPFTSVLSYTSRLLRSNRVMHKNLRSVNLSMFLAPPKKFFRGELEFFRREMTSCPCSSPDKQL